MNKASQARQKALDAVPKTASLLCPDNLLPLAVKHSAANSLTTILFIGGDLNDVFNYEYIIFDDNFRHVMTEWSVAPQFLQYIRGHPAYRLVSSEHGVQVFQRTGTPKRNLKWQIKSPPTVSPSASGMC